MATRRIFVSHSHQDAEWSNAFVVALQREGIDVWFDKSGLYVGMEWIQTLEREIETRDTFILLITPDSWSSDWVQKELKLALYQHKHILGVIHEHTPRLSGFILIYQLLDAVGWQAEKAAQLVAGALRAQAETMDVVTVETGKEHDLPIVIPERSESGEQQSASVPDGKQHGKLASGANDFIEAIESAPSASRTMLRRLADWAVSLEREGLVNLSTYHGKYGLTLLPRLVRDGVGLVSIYNSNGAYLQFWRSVFERRAPHSLARIEPLIAPKAVGQGTWTPDITEELLVAVTLAYREAVLQQ